MSLSEEEIWDFVIAEHARVDELAARGDFEGARVLLENCKDANRALRLLLEAG